MPTKRDFYDLIKPGWVSVWVGEFISDDEFEDYLLAEFADEFGFEIPDQAVHEIRAEPVSIDVSKLVDGFSRSKAFDSKVIRAAEAQGISRASCMLIIYNFSFDPAADLAASTRVKFIGSVPFPGFG